MVETNLYTLSILEHPQYADGCVRNVTIMSWYTAINDEQV